MMDISISLCVSFLPAVRALRAVSVHAVGPGATGELHCLCASSADEVRSGHVVHPVRSPDGPLEQADSLALIIRALDRELVSVTVGRLSVGFEHLSLLVSAIKSTESDILGHQVRELLLFSGDLTSVVRIEANIHHIIDRC